MVGGHSQQVGDRVRGRKKASLSWALTDLFISCKMAPRTKQDKVGDDGVDGVDVVGGDVRVVENEAASL